MKISYTQRMRQLSSAAICRCHMRNIGMRSWQMHLTF